MNKIVTDSHLESWKQRQALAEQMIPMVGALYRERGIVVQVFGRRLMGASTIDIIKAHRYARQLDAGELDLARTHRMLTVMAEMDLGGPARVDLGKLAMRLPAEASADDLRRLLGSELAAIEGRDAGDQRPRDVVLYGFGRIGRLLARLMIERTGPGNKMRLRAIVVRGGRQGDLAKRASLLRRDSVHGPFNGSITVDEERSAIIANGEFIKVIYADSPDSVDYTAHGIDNALIVDNTGMWRDAGGLSLHLAARGAARVLLTAPGKGEMKNIVYGINDDIIDEDDRILCAASCTTNAIVPVLKAVNDEYGIVSGHLETVHAFTNDQNLIDNYHKSDRRGRSAALNMVITSTGAAKAVAKALPELAGRLTGNAIRVPTPNVSMAVMNLNLGRATDKEALNNFLRDVSLHRASDQVGYTASTEIVSSDLVGTAQAGVVDSQATIVDGDRCVLYVWYDNEYGYSNQVIRVMQKMVGLNFVDVPV